MYNDMYSSLWCHAECCHCPKSFLFFAYSSLPSTPLPAPDLFIVSIVLPFLDYHKVGVIPYLAFSDWFLSLSVQFSSVQFSYSVLSDSLQPHGLQHSRFPYPSPAPRAYSNSCPLSRWCHPIISVVAFSCLQSFPASVSFQMSQLFTSSGQSIGVSASASVLPINIQNYFLQNGLVGSPCSPRDSHSNTTVKNINSLVLSFLYSPALTSIRDYWKNQ